MSIKRTTRGQVPASAASLPPTDVYPHGLPNSCSQIETCGDHSATALCLGMLWKGRWPLRCGLCGRLLCFVPVVWAARRFARRQARERVEVEVCLTMLESTPLRF